MKKRNIGSDFDEFMSEEEILEEPDVVATKQIIARQIAGDGESPYLSL